MLTIVNNHKYPLDESLKKDLRMIFKCTASKLLNKNSREVSTSVYFSDRDEITRLNNDYRGKNFQTDVLSFKFDTEIASDYLGDIVICYPVAVDQSVAYQHSLRREICFLFLHGLLHLIGYDHQDEKDEEVMFSTQREILNSLEIKRFE